MNQPLNHQPILSNVSHPAQSPQRFFVTRWQRLGLATFALGSILLANTVMFTPMPVANAMSTTAHHLSYSGAREFQSIPAPVRPSPTPEATPIPLEPITVDSASIPVPLFRYQSFTLSGTTAASGASVRITSDGLPIGNGTSDANGVWAIPMQFTYPGAYTLRALVIIDRKVIAESAPIYISVNDIPTPTPHSQP